MLFFIDFILMIIFVFLYANSDKILKLVYVDIYTFVHIVKRTAIIEIRQNNKIMEPNNDLDNIFFVSVTDLFV